MEIIKCLTISTAHVKEKTILMLANEAEQNKMSLSVYEKADYGYWIYIPICGELSKNIPLDLMACINVARSNGCELLCLDCDGEEIDTVPVYY